MFWKYSLTTLENEINLKLESNSGSITIAEADEISLKIESYLADNMLNDESFFLSSKLMTKTAERVSGISLTDYIVQTSESQFNIYSINLLKKSLKYLKKGLAIKENAARSNDVILLLSKLYIYTGYSQEELLFDLIQDIADPTTIEDIENRRLYGFLTVRSGQVDVGIDYLKKYGDIKNTSDSLFLAGVYKLSKQYTDAIILYKEILNSNPTSDQTVIVRFSLGEIYFEQSLFNEALEQFSQLLIENPEDRIIKDYMVKTYRELGDEDTAETYL
jgi:tetratricopeptide (TPR) repeat protein